MIHSGSLPVGRISKFKKQHNFRKKTDSKAKIQDNKASKH